GIAGPTATTEEAVASTWWADVLELVAPEGLGRDVTCPPGTVGALRPATAQSQDPSRLPREPTGTFQKLVLSALREAEGAVPAHGPEPWTLETILAKAGSKSAPKQIVKELRK